LVKFPFFSGSAAQFYCCCQRQMFSEVRPEFQVGIPAVSMDMDEEV